MTEKDLKELLQRQVLTVIAPRFFDRTWSSGKIDGGPLGTWELSYTPQQHFKKASIFINALAAQVTLIESNPRKVIDPKNKVMIYFEPRDGPRQVGQVRRRGDKLSLHWFS